MLASVEASKSREILEMSPARRRLGVMVGPELERLTTVHVGHLGLDIEVIRNTQRLEEIEIAIISGIEEAKAILVSLKGRTVVVFEDFSSGDEEVYKILGFRYFCTRTALARMIGKLLNLKFE